MFYYDNTATLHCFCSVHCLIQDSNYAWSCKEVETFFADVPTLERAKEISDEAMRENNIDGTSWLKEVVRLNNENIKQQSTDIEIQYFMLNNGCFCGVSNEIMCELAVNVVKNCNDDLIYFGAYTNG